MIYAKLFLIIILVICIFFAIFKILDQNSEKDNLINNNLNNVVENFNTQEYPNIIFICNSSQESFNGIFSKDTYNYNRNISYNKFNYDNGDCDSSYINIDLDDQNATEITIHQHFYSSEPNSLGLYSYNYCLGINDNNSFNNSKVTSIENTTFEQTMPKLYIFKLFLQIV